ncbi:hypothetical protein WN944_012926 [Citrus x changshan-huyou]|uniref:PHD-type domain-containing protein n=1 Tax=Citrus x changshan-huyou TaxID=2935761 RepID=A0AAP0M5M3_9ROSI
MSFDGTRPTTTANFRQSKINIVPESLNFRSLNYLFIFCSHILDLSHFRSHVLSNKTSKRKPKDEFHSEELVVSPMSPELSEGKKRKRKDYSEERSDERGCKLDEEDPEVEECRICFRAGRNVMLECDDCLGGFHLKCLKPPLKEVPEGEWVCEFCEARKLGKKIELPKPLEGKKRVRTMREKLVSSDLWAANIQRFLEFHCCGCYDLV